MITLRTRLRLKSIKKVYQVLLAKIIPSKCCKEKNVISEWINFLPLETIFSSSIDQTRNKFQPKSQDQVRRACWQWIRSLVATIITSIYQLTSYLFQSSTKVANKKTASSKTSLVSNPIKNPLCAKERVMTRSRHLSYIKREESRPVASSKLIEA